MKFFLDNGNVEKTTLIVLFSLRHYDPVCYVLSLINYSLIKRNNIKINVDYTFKPFNLNISHSPSKNSLIRHPYVQHYFIVNFFLSNAQNTLSCSAVDVPMESLDTLNLRVGECSFLEIALADVNRYINTFILEKKMLVTA